MNGSTAARRRATGIGLSAVAIWSTLALFGALAGPVPPLQLVAMAFTLVFALSLAVWTARGDNPLAHLRQPPAVWALGIAGLFGYHLLYFIGIQNAPPAEANLINYLWPVLIVLFSALLPADSGVGRLRWYHVAGALAGLAGAALILTGGTDLSFRPEYTPGYAAAIGAALAWSSYSVLSRRFAHVSTDAVGAFCGGTALLAWIAHLALEPTVWPHGTVAWLAVIGLGLGPVGTAFFVWDHGVKHGDLRVLGAGAYAAPLLSTILLVAAGLATATWSLAIACGLIVGGGLLAARDMIRNA
ncbi:MAG: EamA family transporter [Alphaproteobacteria bacterium]|nr:EamA family transporter [Alphaproteobacteria bacterium]